MQGEDKRESTCKELGLAEVSVFFSFSFAESKSYQLIDRSSLYSQFFIIYFFVLCFKSLYVMWSSKMSRNSQILIFRYSQTKQIISLFAIVFVTL